jgi:hypothetical protein
MAAMDNTRRARRAACLLAASLLLAPALAQQAADSPEATVAGGYVIEVIVFRGGSGGGGEDLGATSGLPSAEGDSSTGGTRTSRVLQTLPSSRLKLMGVSSRLNATPGYRVVAHATWVQTASAWGSRVGLPIEELGLRGAGLSGVVHLERGQYLHLGFNLTLNGEAGTLRMNELRRVKFNERNYFDHPAFGVIAVVSPSGS